MFGVAKLFSSFDDIKHGNTAKTNLKLMDLLPLQHMHLPDGVNVLNKISLAQTFCTPFADCNSNTPSNGRYVATCSNYPDFAVSWKDSKNVTSYLVGMKVRVRFQNGITYGSVSAGTYPYLNINSSGAFPMLAQGKPMATGAISAGQTVEFTLIPYGSSYAWDADSNVRESTNDYTIYTDGKKMYRSDTKKVIPLTPVFGGETDGYRLDYYRVGDHLLIGQSAVFISGRVGTDYHVIHYITKNSESDYTDVTLYSAGVATNGMNGNGNMYVYYWNATEEIEACLIVA